MDVINVRYTYTTKFILPLLFEKDIKYNRILDEFFVNAFIADMANKDNDDKIHLLFADYPSLAFQKLLPEPITEYRYDEGYVLVYSLPIKYEEDYLKFLIGDYSKFSDDVKQKIVNFWEVDNNTLLWGVLYKSGVRVSAFYKKLLNKDVDDLAPSAEWWAPPQIEREILGLVKS